MILITLSAGVSGGGGDGLEVEMMVDSRKKWWRRLYGSKVKVVVVVVGQVQGMPMVD